MKLLVGLGNPGKEYETTRHNVGFMFIDKIIESSIIELSKSEYKFLKPDTFMNKSGEAVSKEANFYKIVPENIIVVHDDLDISLGLWKMQKGKGPKLHYGIQSIEEKLGTKDFWRIRIGVDNRKDQKISGESYVLQKFSETETEVLEKVFHEIMEQIKW